jgi:octaprenyl-diphosphate synthase
MSDSLSKELAQDIMAGGIILARSLLTDPSAQMERCPQLSCAPHSQVHETVIAQELQRVEEALLETVASEVALLHQAGAYAVNSGGKRMRPRVLLLGHRALGGRATSKAVRAAAAAELLHAASLVHDDINDRSDLRRGQASANNRWGAGLALLIGDYVFVRLLKVLASLDNNRIMNVLADCCTDIVEGETLQMLQLGDLTITEEDYLDVVSRKTASLFAGCAQVGGILAAGDAAQEEHIAALREYGLCLGIGFQIRDDTLDWVGSRDELGKPVVSDIAQGKMSLATILAMRESEQARELFSEPHMPATKQIQTVLHETGAIAYAMAQAREYARRAKAALSSLPETAAKEELFGLVDYAIARAR